MRKMALSLMVILVAAAMPASAIENGFYLGGSIGGSSLEVQDVAEEFGAFRFSDGDTAYKLFGGFRFLNFLAVLDDAIDSESESGTDAAYGIGVALRLGKVALRAEGEQFKIADADDVYMFSVGATFTF